jgi:hypothetical protein
MAFSPPPQAAHDPLLWQGTRNEHHQILPTAHTLAVMAKAIDAQREGLPQLEVARNNHPAPFADASTLSVRKHLDSDAKLRP